MLSLFTALWKKQIFNLLAREVVALVTWRGEKEGKKGMKGHVPFHSLKVQTVSHENKFMSNYPQCIK